MAVDTTYFDDAQKAVYNVLEAANAKDENSALDLKLLVQACHEQGIKENTELEKAIVQLIDMDVVDYEMDDQNQPNIVWLLNEDFSA